MFMSSVSCFSIVHLIVGGFFKKLGLVFSCTVYCFEMVHVVHAVLN